MKPGRWIDPEVMLLFNCGDQGLMVHERDKIAA
jgi:hypothetical protein